MLTWRAALSLKKYFGDKGTGYLRQSSFKWRFLKNLRGRGTESEDGLSRRLFKANFEMSFQDQSDQVLVNEHLILPLAEAQRPTNEFKMKVGLSSARLIHPSDIWLSLTSWRKQTDLINVVCGNAFIIRLNLPEELWPHDSTGTIWFLTPCMNITSSRYQMLNFICRGPITQFIPSFICRKTSG